MKFLNIAALLLSAVASIKIGIAEQGNELTDPQIEAIFKKYDSEGNGLDWNEFRHFVKDITPGRLTR